MRKGGLLNTFIFPGTVTMREPPPPHGMVARFLWGCTPTNISTRPAHRKVTAETFDLRSERLGCCGAIKTRSYRVSCKVSRALVGRSDPCSRPLGGNSHQAMFGGKTFFTSFDLGQSFQLGPPARVTLARAICAAQRHFRLVLASILGLQKVAGWRATSVLHVSPRRVKQKKISSLLISSLLISSFLISSLLSLLISFSSSHPPASHPSSYLFSLLHSFHSLLKKKNEKVERTVKSSGCFDRLEHPLLGERA